MKPEIIDLKIAQAIKTLRLNKGISQKSIAVDLRMNPSYYNKHEKGLKAFTGGQLIIISQSLGVSILLLLEK